jgi:hypothetical protein
MRRGRLSRAEDLEQVSRFGAVTTYWRAEASTPGIPRWSTRPTSRSSNLKLLTVDPEELEKRNEEIKSRFVEFFGA